jgi:malate synthase
VEGKDIMQQLMEQTQVITGCECCGNENVEVQGIYRALFPPIPEAHLEALRATCPQEADLYEQGMNTSERWIACNTCAQLDTTRFHEIMQARLEQAIQASEQMIGLPEDTVDA